MEKLIIQVRVNEGQMRASNPHVPYGPEEIAEQIVECWRAGASVAHYHARDPETGAPSNDPGLYHVPDARAPRCSRTWVNGSPISSPWRRTRRRGPIACRPTC